MKIFNEKFSKGLIYSGIIIFIVTISGFNEKQEWYKFILGDPLKLSSYGDFIGGIVGSLWALAGVLLFYIALQDQRTDIRTNREILQVEVKALEEQVNEIRLQTQELELSRIIFQEQSFTIKKQQFESTFFNSVALLNNIINDLEYSDDIKGRKTFKKLFSAFENKYAKVIKKSEIDLRLGMIDKLDPKILVAEAFDIFFIEHQDKIGHYFTTLYNIFRFVDLQSSDISVSYYLKLVRAQLSSFECILLFYNGLSTRGEKFKNYIEKYCLFDNLTTDLLLEKTHVDLYDVQAFKITS